MKAALTFATFERVALIGHAASTDSGRPILMGLNMIVAGDALTAVATDSYKLATTSVGVDGNSDGTLNLPARGIFDVVRTIRSLARTRNIRRPALSSAVVTISGEPANETTVSVHYGTSEIAAIALPSIDGKYPNHTNIVKSPEALDAAPNTPRVAFSPYHAALLHRTVPDGDVLPVVWHIHDELTAIHMTCSSDRAWQGILMPVRIT